MIPKFMLGMAFVTSMSLAVRSGRGEVPDVETLKAAGIRRIESRHLTLYTDLPTSKPIDSLPQAFDQAIPQWAAFFQVEAKVFENWRVVACVIQNKERFGEYGLLPADIPPFLYGFQKFDHVWVFEQPSDYYRRHLLLHEGTHAAMNRIFGRVGPGWYREGIAELLGTHRFVDGKLTMGFFPEDKRQVELWGRIKIVRDAIEKDGPRSISDIVNTRTKEFLSVDSYAWCWALQSFGHNHPKFAPAFRELHDEMYRSTHAVTKRFLSYYHSQRAEIDRGWELFLDQLDYGYDSRQETITTTAARQLPGDEIATLQIDTQKGWQSSGLKLPPGVAVDVSARGRFQVKAESPPWISEPQGVTIEYYQGRPLGMLIAAIVAEGDAAAGNERSGTSAWSETYGIGRRGRITSKRDGVLYFRINERADRMSDNRGQITVRIRASSKKTAKKG